MLPMIVLLHLRVMRSAADDVILLPHLLSACYLPHRLP